MGPDAAIDYDALVLRWMDRWVKGEDNGVDQEPPVRVYLMGAGSGWSFRTGRRRERGSGRCTWTGRRADGRTGSS